MTTDKYSVEEIKEWLEWLSNEQYPNSPIKNSFQNVKITLIESNDGIKNYFEKKKRGK